MSWTWQGAQVGRSGEEATLESLPQVKKWGILPMGPEALKWCRGARCEILRVAWLASVLCGHRPGPHSSLSTSLS